MASFFKKSGIDVDDPKNLMAFINDSVPFGAVRALVYVASESENTDVYFDDLEVEHHLGFIFQEEHYYPFGMTMSGIGLRGLDYHKFTYNSKELVDDFEFEWSDYGARMLRSDLELFNTPDPMAEKFFSWSTYACVLNNPLKYINPDGRVPYSIITRAFAPFETFGGFFHGDKKRYTADETVSARIHQRINFDIDKAKASAGILISF